MATFTLIALNAVLSFTVGYLLQWIVRAHLSLQAVKRRYHNEEV